jgi:hypothetical protein
VSKQKSHRFHVERFNLKKLKEYKSQCNVEILNNFTAFKNVDAEVDIN